MRPHEARSAAETARIIGITARDDEFLVAVLVAIQPRSTPFRRDRPRPLVQVGLIGTAMIRAANADWSRHRWPR